MLHDCRVAPPDIAEWPPVQKTEKAAGSSLFDSHLRWLTTCRLWHVTSYLLAFVSFSSFRSCSLQAFSPASASLSSLG